jgi:hypothetical protein
MVLPVVSLQQQSLTSSSSSVVSPPVETLVGSSILPYYEVVQVSPLLLEGLTGVTSLPNVPHIATLNSHVTVFVLSETGFKGWTAAMTALFPLPNALQPYRLPLVRPISTVAPPGGLLSVPVPKSQKVIQMSKIVYL